MRDSRDDVDDDLAAVHMEETLHQRRPLDDEGRDEQVVADAREAVALEERHQVPEPDEHHDVHVLEHCNVKKHTCTYM